MTTSREFMRTPAAFPELGDWLALDKERSDYWNAVGANRIAPRKDSYHPRPNTLRIEIERLNGRWVTGPGDLLALEHEDPAELIRMRIAAQKEGQPSMDEDCTQILIMIPLDDVKALAEKL